MSVSPYHRYYDTLYASKQYARESEIVHRAAMRILGRAPRRVIDVGCGTGSHSLAFARAGSTVVGVDIDPAFIHIARERAAAVPSAHRPQFFVQDVVATRTRARFDLAVSLFNVVNYIDREEYLLRFLHAIAVRLHRRGVLIFDCWNGIAAIREQPQVKRVRVALDGFVLTAVARPSDVDCFRQRVHMRNDVLVQRNHRTRHFSFSYVSTLWTPWQLTIALERAGFRVRAISQWMKPRVAADVRQWKIMFICQRMD